MKTDHIANDVSEMSRLRTFHKTKEKGKLHAGLQGKKASTTWNQDLSPTCLSFVCKSEQSSDFFSLILLLLTFLKRRVVVIQAGGKVQNKDEHEHVAK